jgi:hypothetical protein
MIFGIPVPEVVSWQERVEAQVLEEYQYLSTVDVWESLLGKVLI